MEDTGSTHKVATYDELVCYSLSLLQNTSHLHSTAGILHCDLKPDNVLWDPARKRIQIIDFGHAQEEEEGASAACVRGTTGFMAPEIESGAAKNTRASDAYSVGAILHFLHQKGFPNDDDDRLGIRDIASALMTTNPNSRISIDKACHMLMSQMDERDDQPYRKKPKSWIG